MTMGDGRGRRNVPEANQLKFQAIRIQQEILHSHNDKAFIISPRFLAAIHNNNLLERIRDISQRMELLSLFFFRSHIIGNLNVISLRIYHIYECR